MITRQPRALPSGFSLVELLIVMLIVAGFGLIGLRMASAFLAAERVEAATRRIVDGLEQGRLSAIRSARACGLRLRGSAGWTAPATGTVQSCNQIQLADTDGEDPGRIQLEHNLPEVVRFTSNGLIIDGGTIKLTESGAGITRCLVISLPLGVVRVGLWDGDNCRPDPIS
jgi:prepilin-type N-terminal cleavage/methylation domain-containing protein